MGSLPHVYVSVVGHGLAKDHLHVHVVARHPETPDDVRGLDAVASWDGKPMIGEDEIAKLAAALRDVYLPA